MGDVQVLVPIVLLVLGFAACWHKWLWVVASITVVGFAGWQWSNGAYSDSGHEIGFSMFVIALMLIPVVAGAMVGWIVRAVLR